MVNNNLKWFGYKLYNTNNTQKYNIDIKNIYSLLSKKINTLIFIWFNKMRVVSSHFTSIGSTGTQIPYFHVVFLAVLRPMEME